MAKYLLKYFSMYHSQSLDTENCVLQHAGQWVLECDFYWHFFTVYIYIYIYISNIFLQIFGNIQKGQISIKIFFNVYIYFYIFSTNIFKKYEYLENRFVLKTFKNIISYTHAHTSQLKKNFVRCLYCNTSKHITHWNKNK